MASADDAQAATDQFLRDQADFHKIVKGSATDLVALDNGQQQKTIAGVLRDAATGLGYQPAVAYLGGVNVTQPTYTVAYQTGIYAPRFEKLPFVTSAAFDPSYWHIVQLNYAEYRKTRRRGRLYNQGGLPRMFAKMMNFKEQGGTVFNIVGLGSSVGAGQTLPDPSTQSPLAYLAAKFTARFNVSGVYKFNPGKNYSVPGSSVGSAVQQYNKAVTDGFNPDILALLYGMNDGRPDNYNSQAGFDGFKNQLYEICSRAMDAGCDPIIFTTPWPNTDAFVYGDLADPTLFRTWPTFKAAPVKAADLIPLPADSTFMADPLGRGVNIAVPTRWARINEAMRWVAMTLGLPLIDVEKYWIEALYDYPQQSIIPASEIVHPNLLGHQLSYWLAIDDFVESLVEGRGFGPSGFGVGDRLGINVNGRAGAILQAYAPIGDTTTQRMNLFDKIKIAADGTTGVPNFLGMDYGNGQGGAISFGGNYGYTSSGAPITLDLTNNEVGAIIAVMGNNGGVGQTVGLYLAKKTGSSTTLSAIKEDTNIARPYNITIAGATVTIAATANSNTELRFAMLRF